MRAFLAFFVVLVLLSACKKDADALAPAALFGKDWYNTRQQPDAAGFSLYKVKGTYTPQIGWGIDGFRLEEDGRFVLHTQGPADDALDIAGTWQVEDSDTYRIQLDNGQPAYLLTIQMVDVDENTLRAKRE